MLQITTFAGLVCWFWNASNAVNYSVCWFSKCFERCKLQSLWLWSISNAVHVNDNVYWSWKALHAVIYGVCSFWNVRRLYTTAVTLQYLLVLECFTSCNLQHLLVLEHSKFCNLQHLLVLERFKRCKLQLQLFLECFSCYE